MIKVENLKVEAEEKVLLNDVDLDLPEGKRILLMGPNGSGKSTLAMVLLGDNRFEVKSGKVSLSEGNGAVTDILKLKPDERAQKGLYIGFQVPVEIPGVNTYNLLRAAYRKVHPNDDMALDIGDFSEYVNSIADDLRIDIQLLERGVNEGFSGGEKKKLELLQMLALKPGYVVLDEPDSGLDSDSLKLVDKALESLDKNTAVLLISHNPRRLGIKKFDKVYVMKEGEIVKSGGSELVDIVLKSGYENF